MSPKNMNISAISNKGWNHGLMVGQTIDLRAKMAVVGGGGIYVKKKVFYCKTKPFQIFREIIDHGIKQNTCNNQRMKSRCF